MLACTQCVRRFPPSFPYPDIPSFPPSFFLSSFLPFPRHLLLSGQPRRTRSDAGVRLPRRIQRLMRKISRLRHQQETRVHDGGDGARPIPAEDERFYVEPYTSSVAPTMYYSKPRGIQRSTTTSALARGALRGTPGGPPPLAREHSDSALLHPLVEPSHIRRRASSRFSEMSEEDIVPRLAAGSSANLSLSLALRRRAFR